VSTERSRPLSPERNLVSQTSTQHGEVVLQSPPKSPGKSRLEVTFYREDDEVCTPVIQEYETKKFFQFWSLKTSINNCRMMKCKQK
jgi:hypothetical protein